MFAQLFIWVNNSLFASIAILSLCATLAIIIAKKACEVIFILPNQVIRWIGGAPDSFDESSAMAEASHGMEQGKGEAEATSKGVAAGAEGAGKGIGRMGAKTRRK